MVGSPLMNMNTSLMPAQGINPQALALLQAALKQGQPGQGQPGGGAPANPGLLAPGGGAANMMAGGMGNGLLSKLFPQTQTSPTPLAAPGMPPLDPNAPPVVPPMDMGGSGPSPTALTGLW